MKIKHICEVCGREEILTPDEGFEKGWDMPPRMYSYKFISPRTCGKCSIKDTLWWKIVVEKKAIDDLAEQQLKTLERILGEPETLYIEEE